MSDDCVWAFPFSLAVFIVDVSWRFVTQEYFVVWVVNVRDSFSVFAFVVVVYSLLFSVAYDFPVGFITGVENSVASKH